MAGDGAMLWLTAWSR